MAPPVKEDLKWKIINMYKDGNTINSISIATGYGNQTISNVLAGAGVRPKRSHLGREGQDTILSLYNKGKTIQEIVKITGKSESTVRRYVIK